MISWLVVSCGGSSGGNSSEIAPPVTSPPATTPLVSFSVSDAPSDAVTSVNITISSITLKSENDDEYDESGLTFDILDNEGTPSTVTIDLMDYQNGDTKLIISNVELPTGSYKNLILNTSGCPQNQNGSTEFCWVVDSEGIKTLKTPSNKLKLGDLDITSDTEQSYNIEFNLRSSMTNTAGGASYNLKPHGIRVVNNDNTGSLAGTVNANLLNSADGCEMVFEENTDHGKIVYLYAGEISEQVIMADEYDPELAQNELPDNLIGPYASESISFDAEKNEYSYQFSHLSAGTYTAAFSCSAVNDDSSEYDAITIANPSSQFHTIEITANTMSEQNFTEN